MENALTCKELHQNNARKPKVSVSGMLSTKIANKSHSETTVYPLTVNLSFDCQSKQQASLERHYVPKDMGHWIFLDGWTDGKSDMSLTIFHPLRGIENTIFPKMPTINELINIHNFNTKNAR